MTETQFNKLFNEEFGVDMRISAVFIDSFHESSDTGQYTSFINNTNILFECGKTSLSFEYKDISITLTQIRKLKNTVASLEGINGKHTIEIQRVKNANKYMTDKIQDSGLTPIDKINMAEQCYSSKYYNQTEIGTFGAGIIIVGFLGTSSYVHP